MRFKKILILLGIITILGAGFASKTYAEEVTTQEMTGEVTTQETTEESTTQGQKEETTAPEPSPQVVKLTEEFFPDKTLREAIVKYDKNKDEILSDSEIEKITKVEISNKKQLDLKGLSYLKNISTLSIESKNVLNIPEVEQLAKLAYFTLKANKNVKELDLSHNTKLWSVKFFSCKVEKVDFQKNGKLQYLTINNCSIKAFKTKKLKKLSQLNLNMTKNKKVVLKNLNNIKRIDLDSNAKKIIIKNCKKLDDLNLNINKTKSLSLYKLNKLTGLVIEADKYLKTLKINKAKKLWELECDGCKSITEWDASNLKKLRTFRWDNGNLYSLKLYKKNKIKEFICWFNKADVEFQSMVTNLKNVEEIELDKSNFKGTLDLSKYPKLYRITCDDNKFEKMIAGKNNKKLDIVSCDNNKLKLIDFSYIAPWVLYSRGNPGLTVYISLWESYNRFGKGTKVIETDF